MRVFSLTGGIACGKSTVTARWRSQGLHVVDADDASKKAVESGTHAYDKIVEFFGNDILLSDCSIDRAKLGNFVFSDERLRKILESIVHPEVKSIIDKELNALESSGVELVCYDCPLLFETGLYAQYDTIVTVKAHPVIQLLRLMERNNLSIEHAQQRIDSQFDISLKESMSDYVIDNTGSITNLYNQCDIVLKAVRNKQTLNSSM